MTNKDQSGPLDSGARPPRAAVDGKRGDGGLLGLAVGTGLQVLAQLMEADVAGGALLPCQLR